MLLVLSFNYPTFSYFKHFNNLWIIKLSAVLSNPPAMSPVYIFLGVTFLLQCQLISIQTSPTPPIPPHSPSKQKVRLTLPEMKVVYDLLGQKVKSKAMSISQAEPSVCYHTAYGGLGAFCQHFFTCDFLRSFLRVSQILDESLLGNLCSKA